jgi:hypothetical protein
LHKIALLLFRIKNAIFFLVGAKRKQESILGVAEKHNFRGIQQKIPQVSDFAKKWDSNPPPHGGTAADIAKMFAKIFSRKSDFG